MPVAHYENFPVASVLLPPRLRRPVEAIYWFARSADDIADEGDHPADWRLAALDAYRRELDDIAVGVARRDPAWQRVAAAIRDFRLPLQPFHDLLDAFAQDVVQARYPDFADVERYCRRSANPVGLLMLHLFEAATPQNVRDSDAICTSLQLLNFCQDVALDWKKNRIYIPLDEMAEHRVSERHIAEGIVDAAWQALFAQQLERARGLLRSGSRLPERLHGRSAIELRAIVAGGEQIGRRLEQTGGDVFRRRPVLARRDWVLILLRAFHLLPLPAPTPDPVPASAR